MLDAPGMIDDFYSSVLDWNHSSSLIGVALHDNLYVYNPDERKINQLVAGNAALNPPLITAVKFKPSGELVSFGSERGVVSIWDIARERECATMSNDDGHHIGALEWSRHWHEGALVAFASKTDTRMYFGDLRASKAAVQRMEMPTKCVSLKWAPDGNKFAVGGRDRCVSIFDVRCLRARVFRLAYHSSSIRAVAWSPHNHNVLISGLLTCPFCTFVHL